MYYHSRPLKYVQYGKITPIWANDNWFDLNYKWLGQFCGYAPQMWLSKGDISMTGFKNKEYKHNKDDILFGFDIIKGFPVSYDPWCFSLNAFLGMIDVKAVINSRGDGDQCTQARESISTMRLNRQLDIHLRESWKMCHSHIPEEDCSEPYMKDLETFKEHLFKEVDQVVVPALNLKSAKVIICRNEKQKKALRKKGFIEDRIKIKNIKRSDF